ncbi:hypothetical protein ABBQ38_006339 [Trebouxia sp. C0009 RCD-2024]
MSSCLSSSSVCPLPEVADMTTHLDAVCRNAPGLSDGPDQSPVNRHIQLGRAILGLTHGNPVKVFHAEGNALDYRKTHLTLIDPNRNLSNSGPAIAPAHQPQGSTSHPPPVVEIDNPPCSKVCSLAELRAMKFDYHPTHYAPRPDTHQADDDDDESDPDTSSVDSTEENEFHNTSEGPVMIRRLSPIYSKLIRALISWPDLMLSLQKTLIPPVLQRAMGLTLLLFLDVMSLSGFISNWCYICSVCFLLYFLENVDIIAMIYTFVITPSLHNRQV